MQRKFNIALLFYTLTNLWGCKDSYISPYKSPTTGYLVVEGYISGNTATQFTLSRTIKLPGDSAIPAEMGARVAVEGSDNSNHPLAEQAAGVYSSIDTLQLGPTVQYRLSIHTSNGEDYLSDLVAYKVTPPIDSVSWTNNGSGVEIYATTHDPANNTRYYQWNYDYTYEYHSAEQSVVYYDSTATPPAVVERPDSLENYSCWTSGSSTALLLGSSVKLAQDVIYELPVNHIEPNDAQLSVLYSILVRQYALTENGYNFLSLMQKNSESLGSIFDAQPSQITGNIHSLTQPTEQVIGYVSAGTVQQQRIFISRSQVPSTYTVACPIPDTLLPTSESALAVNFGNKYPLYIPLFLAQPMAGGPVKWQSNIPGCIDCRIGGGNNKKPSFWPQ